MLRDLTAFVLGVSLLASSAGVIAQDQDRERDHPAHQWNTQEDPHWHQYLQEHHKRDHDWSHATKREKKAYWKWRDAHPEDSHRDDTHRDDNHHDRDDSHRDDNHRDDNHRDDARPDPH